MTKTEAADWIKSNLPTSTDANGVDMVVYEHPAKSCSICGHDHGDALTERVPVSKLSETHKEMEKAVPDAIPGAKVSEMAGHMDGNANIPDGQDRFFTQP